MSSNDSSTWDVDAFMELQALASRRSDEPYDASRPADHSATFGPELPV
jgi:hypothetical protein